MNDELHIRKATIEDAEGLASLAARTFENSFGSQNRPSNMAKYLAENFSKDRIREQLTDPGTLFMIAEQEDRAVGYYMLRESEPPEMVSDPDPVELVRIYVDKPLLGTGLGSKLIQGCMRRARQLGYRTLWLGVWERNQRAIRFYESWGFSIIGEHKFLLGSDVQNDYLMARSLEAPERTGVEDPAK